jgi:hypothetical protein
VSTSGSTTAASLFQVRAGAATAASAVATGAGAADLWVQAPARWPSSRAARHGAIATPRDRRDVDELAAAIVAPRPVRRIRSRRAARTCRSAASRRRSVAADLGVLDVELVEPVAVAVGVERPGRERVLASSGSSTSRARPRTANSSGVLGDQVGVKA